MSDVTRHCVSTEMKLARDRFITHNEKLLKYAGMTNRLFW